MNFSPLDIGPLDYNPKRFCGIPYAYEEGEMLNYVGSIV